VRHKLLVALNLLPSYNIAKENNFENKQINYIYLKICLNMNPKNIFVDHDGGV
jgi:hypothetical protein